MGAQRLTKDSAISAAEKAFERAGTTTKTIQKRRGPRAKAKGNTEQIASDANGNIAEYEKKLKAEIGTPLTKKRKVRD